MTVRDKVGRTRYIAFRVRPGVRTPSRHMLVSSLRNALAHQGGALVSRGRVSLIRYYGGRGIVRCGHKDKDAMIRMLNGLTDRSVRMLETLATSGSVRAAARHLCRSDSYKTLKDKPSVRVPK